MCSLGQGIGCSEQLAKRRGRCVPCLGYFCLVLHDCCAEPLLQRPTELLAGFGDVSK